MSRLPRKNFIGNNAIGKNATDIYFHKAKNESLIFRREKFYLLLQRRLKKVFMYH